ncbi:MAG: hypothetical protein ACE5IR_11570 [bacterium]
MDTDRPSSPQTIIEEKMREISRNGHYDMVHLFSNEGLPLAEHYNSGVIDKDRLVELSLLLRKVKEMADVMGKISDVKEMIVEGYNNRKIVFRFFQAFNQEVALVIVVPPKVYYRSMTNALIKVIERASF